MSHPDRLRLRIHHIEHPYLHGTDAEGRMYRCSIRDSHYIADMEALSEGDTVMLLDINSEPDGTMSAQRLILEPDYLIDISSLSACFTESGPHPMRYLLSLLAPKEVTKPILLGNTANQFLDDCVNHTPERPASFDTSIRKAFAADALKFAVCPDINASFFQEARDQYAHIQRSVEALHQRYPQGATEGGAMLEPSFICPALGLQGRLDYLQSNLRCLVELKSGKADEYYSKPQGPKQNHTAQLMLYREMLHLNIGIPREEISSMLLYSRYPLFFDGSQHAPIVDEALTLRNAIVRLMRQLVVEADTASIFSQLTPETLNTRPLTGRLWSDYLRPQLSRILTPLHTSDDITLSYFYRYLRFTATEQYLAKVGRSERDRAQSHLWCRTEEEKLAEGNLVGELHLIAFAHDDDCGYDRLTFTLPASDNVPNFRQGDMVLFYIKECPTDSASTQQVHKGTLLQIDAHTLSIGLRQHQHSSAVFPTTATYAMEHDVSDSVFGSLYRSLYTLLQAPDKTKQLLLGNATPRTDVTQQLVGHYPGAQTNTIVTTIKQASDYALIVGAPGAGKTSILLRSIVEEYYRHTHSNILLMAYTNRAVDEICQALERIDEHPPYLRLGSEQSCDERYAHRTLARQTATLRNRDEVRALIANTRIVVSTVSTASARPELFTAKEFHLTVIDEASQILEPQIIGLLSTLRSKFVLIGDHKQLPAIALQSDEEAAIDTPALRELGFSCCKQSLFERLYHRLISTGHPECIATLYQQGRMHPEVSHFANQRFYNSRLQPVPLPHQTTSLSYAVYDHQCPMQTLVAQHRTAFIPCQSPLKEERFKTNSNEAQLCASLVAAIIKLYQANNLPYDARQTIGIIAPFRNQGALIRHALAALDMEEFTLPISIDTVERYQGSQRDIIIYCTTVTSPEQMELIVETTPQSDSPFPLDRKLNVALTRARQQLFVIGIPHVLESDANYRALIQEL